MTIERLAAYLPIDRRHALARGASLPDRGVGAALFADISGFTPLTNNLARELGPQRGAEELSRQLNRIYTALIAEVHRFRGSVTAFSGDAITCWFDGEKAGDSTLLPHSPRSSDRPRRPLPPAADRALACALAMQEIMAGLSTVTTPAGTTVQLAIKVAVAAGSVRRFVVGDPQVQLIDVLAGALLDRLSAAEHTAGRGEVIVAAEALEQLSAPPQICGWRADERSPRGFAVVDGLGASVPATPWPALALDTLESEALRPWLLPPIYTRLQAGQGQFLADLRPAVALFNSFVGIDYDGDPEAGPKLDAYIRWAQRIVARYDGSLLQAQVGDKGSNFYCVFGAPLAHEDDAARATRAALLLREPPAELSFIRDVRIGISQGRMRTGAYGATERLTYGVLGEEVNMAARLMQAAGPGRVYVSAALARVAGEAFGWEELPPLQLKGRAEPMPAAALAGARDRRPLHFQSMLYGLPMVGRVSELASIRRAITEARGGQGRVVAIVGEAGLGKSRLVVESMRLASDHNMTIYSGEAQSYGANDSYLAWESIWLDFFGLDNALPAEDQVAALEAALAAIDPDLLPRLPLLGVVLNLPIADTELTRSLDSRLRKVSLEALLVACVRARARSGPLLFVLEDAHWLDPLSHDLLDVLGHAIFDAPVLIVVAFRPPELAYLRAPRVTALPHATTLNLGELSPAEAADLVSLKQIHLDVGADLPPEVVDRVVARTQGNPFFIEELLNYLHSRGLAPQTADELERLDLPASLYSLVLSRIDQLSERQQTTLKVASVIGRLFRAAWLWGVHPDLGQPQQVRADLDVLNRLELTLLEQNEPDSIYLFKHILTQGVAYETLPYETRSWLHEQVASFLEQAYGHALDQYVDLLAYHYGLSQNDAKKRYYLRRAGEAAQGAYANATAIDYYRRLMALLPRAERGQVALRLGQVLELVGEWDEARASYEIALSLAEAAGDARAEVECRRAVGWLLRKRGDYTGARTWLEQARAGFAALGDPAGLTQALGDIGEVLRMQGEYPAAAERYAESLALAAAAAPAPALLAARAGVLKGAGTLAAQQGDLTQAGVLYEESLQIRRALGDRPGEAAMLNNLGMAAMFREDYVAAEPLFAAGLQLFRKLGDRWSLGGVLNNLGLVARYRGDTARARRLLEESVAVRRSLGDPWGIANALSSLSNLLLHAGELDGIEPLLRESLELNLELGDRLALAYCLEDYAGQAASTGWARRALRLAGAATSLRTELGAPLPAGEQAALARLLAPAAEALGDQTELAWAEGRALSAEEAAALALADAE
jgi:class 3 adenylate cyclase/tetratricopeptide (TPR) repeat protein